MKWPFKPKWSFAIVWNWIPVKRKRLKNVQVGIYETSTGIAVVYGLRTEKNSKLLIQGGHFYQAKELSEKKAALNQFVTEHQLQGADCYYVLAPQHYSLNLVEAPLVPAKETTKALRWVLKDLISFPIEKAIIDAFELPALRAKDNMKMLYAVITQKSIIESIASFVEATSLVLKAIDIPELVLKNIVDELPEAVKGCAFMYLTESVGKLILYREHQVYITRSFEIKLENLKEATEEENKALDALALEIQRSFDYLNSVFRQSMHNIIILTPTLIDKAIIQEFLKNVLGAEVKTFKLIDNIDFATSFTEEDEANCLLAIGAVLRKEEKVNDAAN